MNSTVRLQVLVIGLGFAGNSGAQCDANAQLGNGNWKVEILSSEQRVSVLEAELKNALAHQQDCISATQEKASKNRERGGPNSSGQPRGNSGAVAQQTSSGQGETGSTSRQSTVPIDSNRNNAVEVGANSSVPKIDLPGANGEIRSEENELERVLREAIEKEPDVVKRRALIDRYRQLFGEYTRLE